MRRLMVVSFVTSTTRHLADTTDIGRQFIVIYGVSAEAAVALQALCCDAFATRAATTLPRTRCTSTVCFRVAVARCMILLRQTVGEGG